MQYAIGIFEFTIDDLRLTIENRFRTEALHLFKKCDFNRKSSIVNRQSERGGLDLFDNVCLDNISHLDIGEMLESDPAFESGLHFGDVILEAAQRTDFSLVNHRVVPEQPGFGIAPDHAIQHVGSRNESEFGDPEGVADFGPADIFLLRRISRACRSWQP